MTASQDRVRGHVRPAHAPFTAFPVAAYVFAAAFDIASVAGGARHAWAGQLWHAGTWVLTAGLAGGLIAIVTGLRDVVVLAGRRALAAGAGEAIAAHISVAVVAFLGGAGDLAWRLSLRHPQAFTPLGVAGASLATAVVTVAGGYLGGKLVFGHGLAVAGRAEVSAGLMPELPESVNVDDHDRGAAEGQDAGPFGSEGMPGRRAG
jgi:uncharacterized membrane protein